MFDIIMSAKRSSTGHWLSIVSSYFTLLSATEWTRTSDGVMIYQHGRRRGNRKRSPRLINWPRLFMTYSYYYWGHCRPCSDGCSYRVYTLFESQSVWLAIGSTALAWIDGVSDSFTREDWHDRWWVVCFCLSCDTDIITIRNIISIINCTFTYKNTLRAR